VSRAFLDAGDGLEIHRLDPSDAEALQVLIEANRERLEMWMWWAEASTTETTRAFIEAGQAEDRLDPLAIVVDGDLVGVIGATAEVVMRNREIGYWIASSHEGRGLVTRSCETLIGYLFGSAGCHRITITAATANTRSRAIPERLGFTHEGVLREAGHNPLGYHDIEVYGLLEHEWRSR
jgi:ribosomal-protein-serine acetyltransferase